MLTKNVNKKLSKKIRNSLVQINKTNSFAELAGINDGFL